MIEITFRIAGKTLNIKLPKRVIVYRLLFVLSLLTFVYSVVMITVNLIGYYSNYRLNEEIKKAYYGTQGHTESYQSSTENTVEPTAQNERSARSFSNTWPYALPVIPKYPPRGGLSMGDGEPARKVQPSPGYFIPPVRYQVPELKPRNIDDVLKEQYERIKEINKDAVGWIQIPGTNIDYPVLQAKDNEYYLKRNILRKWINNGSIFADYRNNLDMKDKNRARNIIVYGHNMRDDSMFAQLTRYKKKDFFNKNRTIYFDIMGKHYQWEVFSVYITDLNFNYLVAEFSSDEEFKQYLNAITEKSIHKAKAELTHKDMILTLSTCSYDLKPEEARFVVHAKLVK